MINQSNRQANKQPHADGEEAHFCRHKLLLFTGKHLVHFFVLFLFFIIIIILHAY